MSQTKNDVDQWSAGTKMMSTLALFVLPLFMLVAAPPASAAAEETARKDGWQFEANVYLWGSSIDVTTPRGNDIRGNVNLDKNWYIPYYVDLGAGNSTFTWQGMGGIGYKFSKLDVVAAYRYLYWKIEDNKVVDKLSLSGPAVGMIFRF